MLGGSKMKFSYLVQYIKVMLVLKITNRNFYTKRLSAQIIGIEPFASLYNLSILYLYYSKMNALTIVSRCLNRHFYNVNKLVYYEIYSNDIFGVVMISFENFTVYGNFIRISC